jgi:hypothetical protein
MPTLERVYEIVLALYPADYQARFADEVRATFASVDSGCRRACLELAGLLRGLVVEWAAKLTSDAAARGRHLPDCRKMRPAGVTRAEWARGL